MKALAGYLIAKQSSIYVLFASITTLMFVMAYLLDITEYYFINRNSEKNIILKIMIAIFYTLCIISSLLIVPIIGLLILKQYWTIAILGVYVLLTFYFFISLDSEQDDVANFTIFFYATFLIIKWIIIRLGIALFIGFLILIAITSFVNLFSF